ncbi:hypothetical protein, partial [uncultured Stenotrophomonas sp.]|uniref:hypothetical protein n=1 Tax=uncultured Stenotrophomonas sp. TaxID=165438 RepID=UPI0028047A20
HPWGLDGAIHGANGPASPPRPTSDRFLVTVVDPRHAWMKSVRSRIESGVRSVFLRKPDLTPIYFDI